MAYTVTLIAKINGVDYPRDVRADVDIDHSAFAQDMTWQSDVRTPWRDPKKIDVDVYVVEVVAGKLSRRKIGVFHCMPFSSEITRDEYIDESTAILKAALPQELHQTVRNLISIIDPPNYRESLDRIQEFTACLQPAVAELTRKLSESHAPAVDVSPWIESTKQKRKRKAK